MGTDRWVLVDLASHAAEYGSVEVRKHIKFPLFAYFTLTQVTGVGPERSDASQYSLRGQLRWKPSIACFDGNI